VVNIYHKDDASSSEVKSTTLWDRKVEGGFPETKVEFGLFQKCASGG